MNPFIIGFIALSCWFDWTVKEKETAKVNCDFSLMSSKEKNILYYINLAAHQSLKDYY